MESLISDQIRSYMEFNNFFNPCQHGFRQHRSCVTQLLEVLNDLTNMIENSTPLDIIYLDFSKAFDTVPHTRLLNKLKAYGIDGKILDWIKNFLTNRQQRVKVNSSYSDYSAVTSGIPQGSILGPLLFIIYINDLPECINSSCKIFADDTKLYNNASNQSIIQNDLLNLLEWSRLWPLSFNVNKCCVLHMGNKNDNHEYYMDKDSQTKLKVTELEKDVGVHFSTDLKCDEPRRFGT